MSTSSILVHGLQLHKRQPWQEYGFAQGFQAGAQKSADQFQGLVVTYLKSQRHRHASLAFFKVRTPGEHFSLVFVSTSCHFRVLMFTTSSTTATDKPAVSEAGCTVRLTGQHDMCRLCRCMKGSSQHLLIYGVHYGVWSHAETLKGGTLYLQGELQARDHAIGTLRREKEQQAQIMLKLSPSVADTVRDGTPQDGSFIPAIHQVHQLVGTPTSKSQPWHFTLFELQHVV